MGIMDAFRGRREPADQVTEDAGLSEVPEPIQFHPRTDGLYQAAGGFDEVLRFAGRRLTASPVGSPSGKVAGTSVLAGEYTAGGRFTVQRPFERPVFFAVLDFSPDKFLARRTSTVDGSSRELEYVFVSHTV